MNRDDLATLLALTQLDGVGDARSLELYRAFESSAALLDSHHTEFEQFHYLDSTTHQELQNLHPVINEYRERLDRHEDAGIDVIGIDDDRYPPALRELHAPLVLYAKGDTDRLADPLVSVSGSRETSDAGQEWIREVARELTEEGYTVVSGGALGTDTAAHEGALEGTGTTIVVLPGGVENPIPAANASLFNEVLDDGGLLLSQFPPEAEPERHSYIERNHTISGLSPGTIFVATDGSGGTMAQFDIASDQGRHVFVSASDLDIHPEDGIKTIRASETTTVVSSAEEIHGMLDHSAPPLTDEVGEPTDGEQTSLDGWG